MSRPGAAYHGGFLAEGRDRHSRCFFGKVQLHRELANLTLKGANTGLILSDDAGFSFLICQLAAVALGQPKLDEVGGDIMAALRIAPPDDAYSNFLAKLQLERCRMAAVGAS